MTLFLESDNSVVSELLQEDIWESLLTFVDKKLKGYSTRQADSFIHRAQEMHSETQKHDLIIDIRDAIKDVEKKKLSTDSKDKTEELNLHLTTLKTIETKVKSFNPASVLDKSDDDDEDKKHKTVNLDEE